MLVTFYNNENGINILKNSNLFSKLEEIKEKYNVDEKTVLSILKEFSIGIDFNQETFDISNFLEKKYNLFYISNKMKSTENHIKTIIRRSPQMYKQLENNNVEFNFLKKYGEKVLDEIKKINNIDFSSLTEIPIEIFKNKSIEQLKNLNIPNYIIEKNLIKLGRETEFIKFKELIKKEKDKISTPNSSELQHMYENGDKSITLRFLSSKYNIPYSQIYKMKSMYGWNKKTHVDKKIIKKSDKLEFINSMNIIAKKYLDRYDTLYGLSKRYKMSILSVYDIVKYNFEKNNLDFNFFLSNLIRELPELFIEAKLPIKTLIKIFGVSEFEIKKILSLYIGTFPEGITEYREDLITSNWTEFQFAFLNSDLSDEELSQFLNKPICIIKAKRKDMKDGNLTYFRKQKNWLTIYNKIKDIK